MPNKWTEITKENILIIIRKKISAIISSNKYMVKRNIKIKSSNRDIKSIKLKSKRKYLFLL